MAMRNRTRARGRRNSEKLLGAGIAVEEYGVGIIGPDPRGTAAVVLLGFAAIVAVTVLYFGIIIIPGFLLLAAIYGAIDRPASFAVTDRGLAVLARSEFNGQPRKVITILPETVLHSPTVVRSGGFVHLPDVHLWMRRKEHERLLGAARGGSLRPWAAPVPAGVGVAMNVPGESDGAARGPDGADDIVYCSWCGKERSVNAQAIHYCGSMERPAVFCMHCGTAFHEGAAACGSCGTPATQLSR
jgi:hypothetical protein